MAAVAAINERAAAGLLELQPLVPEASHSADLRRHPPPLATPRCQQKLLARLAGRQRRGAVCARRWE